MTSFDSHRAARHRASTCTLSIAVLFALGSGASGQTSSWKNPVSGSFGDSRLWSRGLPSENGIVLFGLNGGNDAFTVTLDAPHLYNTLAATNQAPIIDLNNLRGPNGAALVVFQLAVSPSIGSSAALTLQHGDILAVFGATVGTNEAPGALQLEDVGAQFAAFNVINGSFTASASSIDAARFNPFLALHLGLSDGADASALFTAGSQAHFTTLVVGGGGGTGSVMITGGATVFTDHSYFGGGNASEGHVSAGDGSMLIDGATVHARSSGPTPPTLYFGWFGTGTLTLRGGALVDGLRVGLGVANGTGHLVIDGPAALTADIVVLSDGNATIAVQGAGTVVNAKSIIAGGVGSTLDLKVDDGAVMNCTTIDADSLAPTTIHVLDGGHLTATSMYVSKGDLLEVSGADSTCHVTTSFVSSAPFPQNFFIDHGGQLQVPQFMLMPQAWLQLGLSKSAIVPVVASGQCNLTGTINVQFEDGFVPSTGTVVTLAQGNPLIAAPVALDVPQVPGLLTVPGATSTAFTLTFTDSVSELAISGPTAIAPGYQVHFSASAIVDGAARDVTSISTWTSSDPSIVVVDAAGTLRGITLGTATITVVAGPATAQVELMIGSVAPLPPFLLASAAIDGIGNGASGDLDASIEPVGRRLSADGLLVAFESGASNLVASDGNGTYDAFVRDLAASTSELASLNSAGQLLVGASGVSCINVDGRFVAFTSNAPLTGVPFTGFNVFLRDRLLGATELISVTTSGQPMTNDGYPQAVSEDGRFVLFSSHSAALVPGDTNNAFDAFVRDRLTNTTTRVSVGATGEQLSGNSFAIDMTPDAKSVLLSITTFDDARHEFTTIAVKRLDTGELINVTQTLGSTTSRHASISDDGRFVAFTALGLGLDGPAPTGSVAQPFVRDLATNEVTPLTRLPDGTWANGGARGLSISGNGRYVSFESSATNLAPGLPTGSRQVWRYDRITGQRELTSESPFGPLVGATGGWTSISLNGRAIVFATDDPNFAAFDTNGAMDVIVRTFGSMVPGDVNNDGAVNAFDLGLLIGAWGTKDASADLDGDGDVDANDLGILLGAWTS